MSDLERVVDDILLSEMPAGLAAALDAALARGVTPADLLALVRHLTGGPTARQGAMTYHMCEAYLELHKEQS